MHVDGRGQPKEKSIKRVNKEEEKNGFIASCYVTVVEVVEEDNRICKYIRIYTYMCVCVCVCGYRFSRDCRIV